MTIFSGYSVIGNSVISYRVKIIPLMPSIKKLYSFLIDFLFPNEEAVKEIENMDVNEFREKTGKVMPFRWVLKNDNYSILQYQNPIVKKVIWQIKYRGNRKITAIVAKIFYEEILAELENKALFENFINPIVVPIPISKKRYKKRGFNQMGLVGKELEKIDQGSSFEYREDILTKTKETLPQTMIKNRSLRMLNLRNCFKVVNRSVIKNRNIILIDDVLTTGSTVAEAKKTLKYAGAKKIIAFTIAH